jgi:U3 small nucleolar RNA-associated protein 3
MAKKRKGSGRGAPSGPKEFDEKDGKLGPITSYRDVADEEDDFHINRDKVMLDEGPEAKRQRKWAEQDAFLEPSDEEVLGYSDASSEDEAEGSGLNKSKSNRKAASDSEVSEAEEEDEDAEGWGSSKKDYYNADNIETEVDALEEEAEAKRLQQKKLQSMSEADFGFDENEWLQEAKDDDGDVVTEILKDVEITNDMGPEERLKLLQTRYPEFEFLANEFVELHPVLEDLNNEISATGPRNTVAVIKSRALAAYLGALTMYFAVLTSTAKQENAKSALDPIELRDHAVMDTLLQCREMWSKTKTLQADDMPFGGLDADEILSDEATPETDDEEEALERIPSTKKSKKAAKLEAAAAATAKARKARIDANEASLTDLSSLIPTTKTLKSSKSKAKPAVVQDSDSDFGEEETLSSRAAAEKAAKKKSLRFYTSQIAQRSNKRNEAGRDAGGDADLPYRERLRDRQNRLNAEAERRGKKLDEYGRGAELGGNSDEDDEADRAAGKKVQDDEDEYYDLVAQTSKAKKAMKEDKHAALVAAEAENSLARVEGEGVGEDGKRAIGYQILKNKGLMGKRSKEVRNPRVKKRMKYEAKLKKLGSMKAIYKGGEERGGYSGEKTGIKAGVVKSVKL